MNKNSDNQNLCQYSDFLLDYVYEEMNLVQSEDFKHHLSYCAHCAVEYQSFSFTRETINAWRNSSFDFLETPKVALPIPQAEAVSQTKKSNFSFKNLFELLQIKPVLTASFAILLLIFTAFFMLRSFESSNFKLAANTADVKNSNNSQPDSDKIQIEISKAENKADRSSEIDLNSPQFSETNLNNSSNSLKTPVNNKERIAKTRNELKANAVKNRPNAKANRVRKSPPRLLDEIEIEESGRIRLTDVFAELE